MNTVIMQALPTHALALATLAGEINLLSDSVQELATKAITSAARLGEKLSLAKSYTDDFEQWLGDNCPRLKRSQAYNYMALAKKMPELLDESVHTTGHLLLPSQAIALLSASDDLKADVLERVEAGESVTVAEINRLKKEKQQADEDYLAVLREKNQIEIENNVLTDAIDDIKRENKALKTDKGIETLVRKFASGEIEKTHKALQRELDKTVAQHANDYQAKIDHLNDGIARLRNDLGKAQHPDRLADIQQQIVSAQDELVRTNYRLEVANAEVTYRKIATHIIEASASMSVGLLDLSGTGVIESATTELLLRAAHDLSSIVELLKNAATIEQFDIEG